MRVQKPLIVLSIILTATGFGAGWFSNQYFGKQSSSSSTAKLLRLQGYKYINPLLAYDIQRDGQPPKFSQLEKDLTAYIAREKEAGRINAVSVYFRNITTGEDLDINPDDRYEPASLNKIPLLFAIYRAAEKNPDFFDQKITIPELQNSNALLEIQPKDFLRPGKTYSVQEAIDKLIIYSDNNAYDALTKIVNFEEFKQSFDDLKVPLQSVSEGEDFLSAKDFSYFLRVLYNGTYLTRSQSETAMELLTKVDFPYGIVAGIPSSIPVAHKFGIASKVEGGIFVSRELHDCGIVYHPERPYLICVMTKGSSTLQDSIKTISNVSKTIFDAVNDNFTTVN